MWLTQPTRGYVAEDLTGAYARGSLIANHHLLTTISQANSCAIELYLLATGTFRYTLTPFFHSKQVSIPIRGRRQLGITGPGDVKSS